MTETQERRGGFVTLNAKKKAAIVRLYKKGGVSLLSVSQQVGCSYIAARMTLHEAGVSVRAFTPVTKDKRKRVIKAFTRKKAPMKRTDDLAQHFGINRSTVYSILEKAGLKKAKSK